MCIRDRFGVPTGQVFGLLGANGAGKTTTVSMICRSIEPTSGDAKVGGRSVLADFEQAARALRGDVVGHRVRAHLGDPRLHPGERAQGPSIFKDDYSFIKYDVEKGEENCRPAAW